MGTQRRVRLPGSERRYSPSQAIGASPQTYTEYGG